MTETRYVVYKLTCVTTGKIYIGVTSRSVERRLAQHFGYASRGDKRRLYIDMAAHGRDLWSVEIIGVAETWSSLLSMERELIASYRSTDPRIGYNATIGGQGTLGLRFTKTPEQKEKSALFHRGRKRGAETIDRMSHARTWWWAGHAVGEKVTKTTRNTQRDVDIAADYYSSPSLAVTGKRFGITGPAVSAAMRRVSARIDMSIQAATGYDCATDTSLPLKIHPDWLDLAI